MPRILKQARPSSRERGAPRPLRTVQGHQYYLLDTLGYALKWGNYSAIPTNLERGTLRGA